MRKFISILLVSCIVLSTAGFCPVFLILQKQVRKEIKQRIKKGVPEGEIQQIVFAPGEKIDWVREGIEFRLNGRMYDIVSQIVEDGEPVFNCINDKQEEVLFANLDSMVKKQMDDDHSSKGSAARFLYKIFMQSFIVQEAFTFFIKSESAGCNLISNIINIPVYLDEETPPPDNIFFMFPETA